MSDKTDSNETTEEDLSIDVDGRRYRNSYFHRFWTALGVESSGAGAFYTSAIALCVGVYHSPKIVRLGWGIITRNRIK